MTREEYLAMAHEALARAAEADDTPRPLPPQRGRRGQQVGPSKRQILLNAALAAQTFAASAPSEHGGEFS